MFFSNIVMFFIILTSGAVLHTAGVTNIQSAAQAAEALRPLAGQAAFLLFAIGIIGVGLLALPVLAGSAAYALASFRWKEGLYRKLKNAYGFLWHSCGSHARRIYSGFCWFRPNPRTHLCRHRQWNRRTHSVILRGFPKWPEFPHGGIRQQSPSECCRLDDNDCDGHNRCCFNSCAIHLEGVRLRLIPLRVSAAGDLVRTG